MGTDDFFFFDIGMDGKKSTSFCVTQLYTLGFFFFKILASSSFNLSFIINPSSSHRQLVFLHSRFFFFDHV